MVETQEQESLQGPGGAPDSSLIPASANSHGPVAHFLSTNQSCWCSQPARRAGSGWGWLSRGISRVPQCPNPYQARMVRVWGWGEDSQKMSVHIARGWKCPARSILLLTQTLHVCADKLTLRAPLTPVPVEVGCPRPGQSGQDRARDKGLEGLSGGKVSRTGLGRPLARLTFLVQNPTGVLGRVVVGGEWVPGSWVESQTTAGAFAQRRDLRAGWCGREEGRQREPDPSHQQSPAETARGKGGPAGLRAQRCGCATWARRSVLGRPSPRCPAHSKVSHCFLSCSTEPGAGAGAWAWAGLTSCLVFRSKSSKGSLVS